MQISIVFPKNGRKKTIPAILTGSPWPENRDGKKNHKKIRNYALYPPGEAAEKPTVFQT